jgi:hypothetical protein
MTYFNYILDNEYKNIIQKTFKYIETNNLWSILKNYSSDNYNNDPLIKDLIIKIDIFHIKEEILIQLIDDLVWICNLDNSDIPSKMHKFKKYYLSERAFKSLPDFDRSLIEPAYNIIQKMELWDYLTNFKVDPETGFMFCTDETIKKIISSINEDNPSHSGFSLGFTMRKLEQLTKN